MDGIRRMAGNGEGGRSAGGRIRQAIEELHNVRLEDLLRLTEEGTLCRVFGLADKTDMPGPVYFDGTIGDLKEDRALLALLTVGGGAVAGIRLRGDKETVGDVLEIVMARR